MKAINERKYEEAVWACEECQVWWGSQSYVKPTNLLLDMPKALSQQLPWHEFRGWKTFDTAVCPQCQHAQEAPVYGEAKTE